MGLPTAAGAAVSGACGPTEPARSPEPAPSIAPAFAETPAPLQLASEPDSGAAASELAPADAAAPRDDAATATMDAGSALGAPRAAPPAPQSAWFASYKLPPGTERWCDTGSVRCQPAADTVAAPDATATRLGCASSIEVECPCTPAGCNTLGEPCVAPLQRAVTQRERVKQKTACCYDLPRQCVPPYVGRPLRGTDGAPCWAEQRKRGDWHTPFDATDLERADESVKNQRARLWTDIAAMEHASIASFARVVLQLMALGAPPDLLRAAHEAALDEIEHARLAFGIATASGAGPIGPGKIDAQAMSVGPVDWSELAAATFRDGCVEETYGAVVAGDLAGEETSPTIRAVLERIARDEERHAELAWRMLAWVLRSGGNGVRQTLAFELARLESDDGASPRKRELISVVVRPCAEALLADAA